MKVLLVGESNPYSGDPADALLPWPAGAAGSRLCVGVLRMSERDYLRAFDRVNLLGDAARWSVPAARLAASSLTHHRRVLLGAKVAAAHGLDFRPFELTVGRGWCALVLPHPSGRSRLWNEPGSADRARVLVERLLHVNDLRWRRAGEHVHPGGGR